MQDNLDSCRRIFPLVMLFELLLIVCWFLKLDECWEGSYGYYYLIGYAALFAVTAAMMLIFAKWKIEEHLKGFAVLQGIYVAAALAWAVYITALDAGRGVESVLIYATVLTIVPLVGFYNVYFLVLLEMAADLLIGEIAYLYYKDFSAFLVNFIVFAAISLTVGLGYRGNRLKNYERQVKLKELSDLRWKYANIDDLTGLLNRRAYDSAMAKAGKKAELVDFTVGIFDLNGLKKINDGLGHAAGDESIKGAAECITAAFQQLGEVYRIGGDEYAVICSDGEHIEEALRKLDQLVSAWKGVNVPSISVSKGYARASQYPKATVMVLEYLADQMMYKDKEAHYQKQADESRRAAAGRKIQMMEQSDAVSMEQLASGAAQTILVTPYPSEDSSE